MSSADRAVITLKKAEETLDFIKKGRAKKGPLMVDLTLGEIESLLVVYVAFKRSSRDTNER